MSILSKVCRSNSRIFNFGGQKLVCEPELPSIKVVWSIGPVLLSLRSLFLILALIWFSAAASFAATSESVETSGVTARIVSAQNGVPFQTMTLSAGLHLRLKPGWKTYWRSPGEVGIPPKVNWSNSKNIAGVEFKWPAPKRFAAFGIENFGYEGEVLFPLQVNLLQPGEAALLSADVSLLVCSEVCVPERFELSLSLPNGNGIDRKVAELIGLYANKVPRDGKEERLLESASVYIDESKTELVTELRAFTPFVEPDLFPELGLGTALGKPDLRMADGNKTLWARFPILAVEEKSTHDPLLTVTDVSDRSFSIAPVIVNKRPSPPFSIEMLAPGIDELVWIAVLAFLGGVILNVMPCVLPVLSIKLSSTLRQYGRQKLAVRGSFLAATAGVMVFVWSLAVFLYVLQQVGISVGWGIQFQNPFFLSMIALVLAVFSASFMGVFEIALPPRLQSLLSRTGSSPGYGGDFFTGMFGAVLATPCSAPFLGTAIAFALAGRGIDILIVFTSLGLGLASPYLILAMAPGLLGLLPKPGKWMVWLKFTLGLLLLGTTLWILWILYGVAGYRTSLLVIVSLLLLIGTLSWRQIPNWARLTGGSALAGFVLLAPALFSQSDLELERTAPGSVLNWASFDRGEIARIVSKGEIVFVDVTADWCITCKANKALVIEQEPVLSALGAIDVTAMQADWTRPDEKITRYLASFGRYGIPFNVIFGPGAPGGLVLPELLTSSEVLDGLSMARGRPPS